jgi:putative spermidine/putrescine transport system substrate-binding protein
MSNTFISRRTAVLALATLAGGSVTSRFALGQENLKGTGEVVVYDGGGAWGAAQKAAYFDPFEQVTGIKVVAAAPVPASAIRTSITAGAPAYDVMDIDGGNLVSFAKDGLLERIDYSLFQPGDKEAISPIPASEFALPALFYSLGVAYDEGVFKGAQPGTWTDMWNVEKFPGKRAMFNAGDDVVVGGVFETALLADGVDPKNLYPLDLDRAFKSLDKIKSQILRFWTYGAEPVQLLLDGSVVICSAPNGRISAIQAQGQPVGFSWKQAILQWDAWAVSKGCKNKENAMKFVAFAAGPAQQAKFAELITYGPTNAMAFKLLTPARASLLPGNPESVASQIVQNYEWWSETDSSGKTNIARAAEMWQKWVIT